MRFGLGVAVCAVAFVLLSCGSNTTTRVGRRHAVASDGVVAAGEPLPARPTEVTGRPSTVELAVKDPARPGLPSMLLALVHGVRREPRDICFGTYARNQAPMNGDVGCQVVGKAPLALVLAENFIPRSVPLARFMAVYVKRIAMSPAWNSSVPADGDDRCRCRRTGCSWRRSRRRSAARSNCARSLPMARPSLTRSPCRSPRPKVGRGRAHEGTERCSIPRWARTSRPSPCGRSSAASGHH